MNIDNFFNFINQEWLLVSGLAALIIVYSWSEKMKSGLPISNNELTVLVNSDKAVLLDIRSSTEFKTGHLVDAINIPHEKVIGDVASLEKHKSKTIIVIDKMGQ